MINIRLRDTSPGHTLPRRSTTTARPAFHEGLMTINNPAPQNAPATHHQCWPQSQPAASPEPHIEPHAAIADPHPQDEEQGHSGMRALMQCPPTGNVPGDRVVAVTRYRLGRFPPGPALLGPCASGVARQARLRTLRYQQWRSGGPWQSETGSVLPCEPPASAQQRQAQQSITQWTWEERASVLLLRA